ncbi:inovirus Gp2 family protein [Candidatus Parcubacteria bacterium]|nr:MAG: inovirus Gp2 family protein [Candidatus Parcubacteria bacterium]
MKISNHNHTLMLKDNTQIILDDHLKEIYSLISFMNEVIYRSQHFYTKTKTKLKNDYEVTKLGKHLPDLGRYAVMFTRDYQFCPEIQFFFENYRRHKISNHHEYLTMFRTGKPSDEIVKVFDDFVATMRKNAIQCKLKKQIGNWRNKPAARVSRINKLLDTLFARYARLMVVRLDLHYKEATLTHEEAEQVIQERLKSRIEDHQAYWSNHEFADFDNASLLAIDDLPLARSKIGKVCFDRVHADRKRLFSNRKGKPLLFRELVGYIWKIECAREAGYHIHVCFLFDGSKVDKHEYYADQIGRYWADVITKGQGYFYNCNKNKASYEKHNRWALGQVDHFDVQKRENLYNSLSYLAKADQAIEFGKQKGDHLFRAEFAKDPTKDPRGRKRTKISKQPKSE